MDSRALIGLSILLSFFASARVAQLYVWPRLRDLPREEALSVLVAPHLFRFIGLSLLLPDVVSPALPHSFALHVAYGDLAALILAWIATLAFSARTSWAIPVTWLLGVVGSADLLYAYYDAMFGVGLPPRCDGRGDLYSNRDRAAAAGRACDDVSRAALRDTWSRPRPGYRFAFRLTLVLARSFGVGDVALRPVSG